MEFLSRQQRRPRTTMELTELLQIATRATFFDRALLLYIQTDDLKKGEREFEFAKCMHESSKRFDRCHDAKEREHSRRFKNGGKRWHDVMSQLRHHFCFPPQ